MKFLASTTLFVATALSLSANTVTVKPGQKDLYDLDHHQAVSWGFDLLAAGLDLGPGMAITSAKITFSNIYNWNKASNSLFVNLMDNPTNGTKYYQDNTKDNVESDYFKDGSYVLKSGQALTSLTTYHDADGPATKVDLVYEFTKSQLNALASYLATAAGEDVAYQTEKYWETEAYTEKQYVWERARGRMALVEKEVVKTRKVQKTRQKAIVTPQATVGLTFDADCHYFNDGISFEVTTSKVPDAASTFGLSAIALLGLGALARRRRA